MKQLSTLNDINIKSATTTDFGGGSWYVDAGDVTSVTNWGNLIVDALCRRWKRIYTGYDELRWYYANPGTDSAVIQRAYNNCKDGLFINNGLYTNLNLIRFNRDGVNVTGESKTKTILKQLGTPTTLSSLLWFQDGGDLNINNVTISNMTLDGNGINQTGTNASIIRQGSGSLDTVKNITFRDVIIKNGARGRSAIYLITDSLRNDGWVFDNCIIDSSYGGAFEWRGVTNITIKNSYIANWSLYDSSVAAAINTQQPMVRGAKIINTTFRSNYASRFTVEASGNYVDFLFKDLYLYGGGRDVNGFSGKGWFNGVWDNINMYDGGGGSLS